MPATYEPIASTTLGSAAADITFSSIASTWTDLLLFVSGKSSNTGTGVDGLRLQFNADTGTNYSNTYLFGDGSTATSGRQSTIAYAYALDLPKSGSTTTSPGISRIQIMNATNANVFKTMLTENAADIYVQRAVALWRSTSAITSIKIYLSSGNLASGTTASLYGIKAA